MMSFLTRDPIRPDEWRQPAVDPRDGASVEFQGLVRREEGGTPITCLEYETYAPMAERVIARLVQQARAQWPLHQVSVRHRVGHVPVGEVALLIGVTAPHRDEAFEACRHAIDALKASVPVWKKEHFEDGEVWVGREGG